MNKGRPCRRWNSKEGNKKNKISEKKNKSVFFQRMTRPSPPKNSERLFWEILRLGDQEFEGNGNKSLEGNCTVTTRM